MVKDLLISDFTNHHFQKAFKLYFDELGINVKDWEALFNEMNDEKDSRAYVRFTDTYDVVGFVQFKPIVLSNWFFSVQLGFIREFWVAKEYRSTGNGKSLLHLAEAYFKENGLQKSILTTDTAEKFYEKNGYVKDSTIIAKNKDDVFVKELR
ncbi:MAG: GNAT family N-acetyltransferase [Eubacteriales bacterium]|nr:GNAT family N-acetyltransferase [Eubacteriales bacterium]